MAEKKSGPVKPPIIDATPHRESAEKRAASGGASGAKPEPSAPAPATPVSATRPDPKQKTPDSKPDSAAQSAPSEASAARSDSAAASPASGSGTMSPLVLAVSAGGGALVGLALAYGVALAGWWPPQPGAMGGGEVAALGTRVIEMEQALAGETSARTALEQRTSAAESALDQLSGAEAPSLDGLAAQSDLNALSTRVGELARRLDAVAAGASAEDSTQISSALTAIAEQVSDLANRLETLEPQMADLAPRLEAAEERLDGLDTRIADQPAFEAVSAERDRMALLPSALGALELAITSGKPFAAELAALEPLLPSLQISPQVRAVAVTGADNDAALLARFRAEIPDILAARPQDPDAGWAQRLLDQAASVIALRPTQGDTPQAWVGRTEEALETGDVTAADAAFAALPVTMQQAASDFSEALARARVARDLLEALRAVDPRMAPAAEAIQ